MRFFRRMDRYVAGYFISSYAVCFMFFLGIFVIIDLVPRLDEILKVGPLAEERGESLFLLVVRYYSFKVPEIFLQVAPYLTLMAAMFTVTRLRKANELIPMIMAGVSIFRIVLPIFGLAATLMVMMIVTQEFAASPCATNRLFAEAFLVHEKDRLVLPQKSLTTPDGRKITVTNYDVTSKVIGSIDISYLEERDNRQLYCVISGQNLRWLGPEEGWSVEEGYIEEERPSGSDREGGKRPITRLGPEELDLTPDDLLLFLKQPTDMSLREVQRLFTMNPSDLALKILLHHHITFPLTNIILLLLGLPFVFRQEKQSNFLGIAISLAICMGYFALDVIMRDMGTQGFLPPVLAAWFSVVFCGSLGICIFDSIRT